MNMNLVAQVMLVLGILVGGAWGGIVGQESTREAVPGEAVLEVGRGQVREKFRREMARASGNERRARELATHLLEGVKESAGNPGMTYALLVEAYDQALAGMDPGQALEAVDRMEALFLGIEGRQLRIDALVATAPKVHRSRAACLATTGLNLLESCLRSEDRRNLSNLAHAIHRPLKRFNRNNEEVLQRLAGLMAEVAQLEPVLEALERIRQRPSDTQAQGIAGRYFTFHAKDFLRGLPLLAAGPPEDELTALAAADLATPVQALDQIQLGQRWDAWGQEQDNPLKQAAFERALYWLNHSQDQFPPGEKAALLKRMQELEQVLALSNSKSTRHAGRIGLLRQEGGKGTEAALQKSLGWLRRHQDEDGSWDSDGFQDHCPLDEKCDDPGNPAYDVGLTGLALLAFLADGSNADQGANRDVVARGFEWLKKQQNQKTGLIGDDSEHDFLYGHAIASLALCEASIGAQDVALRKSAEKAIGFIERARNPQSAWRYSTPPDGDNDTSITCWMVLALSSAEKAGIQVDRAAFEGALVWIDEATDFQTGRVGYNAKGGLSARTRLNENYPREKGEAMTAAGLLARFFLGQAPKDFPIMEQHADLLLRRLPEWDVESFGCDMYYWYYGSYAMFQMGGQRYWKAWNQAMKTTLTRTQKAKSHAEGSWDPVGPWGYTGGRIYSTALMALCLEVYFRYDRLFSDR